ncbi:unnamed protein product [Adineta ricciae]|uniref:Uncharacterized protein n=1 Tax=Adineta ricciae TaxID=249248 RepID=A0A815GZJ5_ADIRI|nr:unnamed protein product [Adineta ricciae]CAF1345437.1 unnamed protein product [Adineta ricciae]
MSVYCNNCFCCGRHLVPRYKRLVNNIFSQNPQHSPDKNNLERLRFYAVHKPEKLDKSFRYMSEKITRYLRHRNRPYVILGITAMTDTMKSCYQQLNTFIDWYLVTLHSVLEERNDLELTEHVIVSFEAFCEIRIEAPNYQRDYEFFVDRFTQLCHNNFPQDEIKFRYLGLRGHQALIRKTASDDLHNNIWVHMNQIVPSILFNMERRNVHQTQESANQTTTVSDDHAIIATDKITKDDLSSLADTILRDLFSRTHMNNMSACFHPILTYLDDHNQWTPVDFPLYIFSAIMVSIKNHNSYIIVDLLLNHLEKKETEHVRTPIMNVIHQCLVFAATNNEARSTIFTGVSRLLRCLEKSFYTGSKLSEASVDFQHEKNFQNAIIDGIRDFTEKLPDFQMIEIMHNILISLLPLNYKYKEQTKRIRDANIQFQLLLLETIQKLVVTYQSIQNDETTFPHQLFDPLLKLMRIPTAEIRWFVLQIFVSLIDKRHYAHKLRKIRISKDIAQLNLPAMTKPTQLVDISFMKKYGSQFLSQLYDCLLMDNNTKDIFYTIHCLMSLIIFEDDDKDILVDMIHFCIEIQKQILVTPKEESKQLSTTTCYCIHALIAAFLNTLSKLYKVTTFSRYVDDFNLFKLTFAIIQFIQLYFR